MQLAKIRYGESVLIVLIQDAVARSLKIPHPQHPQVKSLADVLASPNPEYLAQALIDPAGPELPLEKCEFLAPVDHQEVWAAGVTYQRSKTAREEESQGAASFYDKVYTAPRPELFFKSLPEKVVGPGQPVRIRADSRWNVPEPELAVVVSPDARIVGYTIGNDMSSRDIEGENPLYLPQAKVYRGSCAIGPAITLPQGMPASREQIGIRLTISRQDRIVYDGSTDAGRLNRSLESLVDWLCKENDFPNGVILLTGTGIVPLDDFTLRSGDEIAISIDGIGTLCNKVA